MDVLSFAVPKLTFCRRLSLWRSDSHTGCFRTHHEIGLHADEDLRTRICEFDAGKGSRCAAFDAEYAFREGAFSN